MIGISLLTLNVAAGGGTLTYVRELVRSLAHVGELEYRTLVPPGSADAGGGLPSVVVRAPFSGRGRAAALAGAAFGAVRVDGLAGVHFPVGVMLPRVDSVPAATTLHDLQHEEFPQFFSWSQRAYRRRVYGWTIERSRMLIAISEYVRRSLIERHSVAPDRVRTIHHGIDHAVFSPGTATREPFLLYPANAWPHKNHGRLFEAFALVRRRRPELRLVLTGAGHDRLRLPEGVVSHGRVRVEELVELYRTAAAVVFPALYEGFGLPPLEAMACGCPVAVSRVASLPEVCGEAAIYFDPTSAESVAEGIETVLDRPPAGGIAHAASFTWEECARRHDAVYRELEAG
ncbi:MAG TPA: glycosyltransferase family 1 protein [Gaiellaceae bacterium]|nr:glycosyltransferase family 1 protein [Gaiellaceae bacterium]